jgi:hypothetical protein
MNNMSGGEGVRTPDLVLAKHALSQLSYTPAKLRILDPGRFELPTSRLSSVRSNQLSYGSAKYQREQINAPGIKVRLLSHSRRSKNRKEVIQPHLPIRLPCYDFTPITNHNFGGFPPCGLEHRLLLQRAFVV